VAELALEDVAVLENGDRDGRLRHGTNKALVVGGW